MITRKRTSYSRCPFCNPANPLLSNILEKEVCSLALPSSPNLIGGGCNGGVACLRLFAVVLSAKILIFS